MERKRKLEVLKCVEEWRTKNGIRFFDYARYRKYINRRLHKLRKRYGLTHGKVSAKFSPDRSKLNEEVLKGIENDEVLFIPLLRIERFWATANQLKETDDQKRKGKRSIIIKKNLRKAHREAQRLHALLSNVGDAMTVTQSEAYSAHISGLYHLEVGEFKDSLTNFVKAKTIYSELVQVSSMEPFVSPRLEEITLSVRYCTYLLRKEKMDPRELQSLLNESESNTLLRTRLQGLVDEIRESQRDEVTSVFWAGKNLPLKLSKESLETFQRRIVQARGVLTELEIYLEGGGQEYEKKMNLNGRMATAYNEAKLVLSEDMAKIESNIARSKVKALTDVLRVRYSQYEKIKEYIDVKIQLSEFWSHFYTLEMLISRGKYRKAYAVGIGRMTKVLNFLQKTQISKYYLEMLASFRNFFHLYTKSRLASGKTVKRIAYLEVALEHRSKFEVARKEFGKERDLIASETPLDKFETEFEDKEMDKLQKTLDTYSMEVNLELQTLYLSVSALGGETQSESALEQGIKVIENELDSRWMIPPKPFKISQLPMVVDEYINTVDIPDVAQRTEKKKLFWFF